MRVDAFSKSFDGRTVLDFPGCELEPGRLYAVIGANGSGKSTLARCLAGVERPDGGARPVEKTLRVGYLPQKPYAFRMTTRRNIRLTADAAETEALLEALGLSALADKPAHRLSGGETAKMALARVLPLDCGLLVLDEPTAAMDLESTLAAEALITARCRGRETAVVLITHSLRQARRCADEVLFFCRGRLAERGTAGTVLTEPATPELRQFLSLA